MIAAKACARFGAFIIFMMLMPLTALAAPFAAFVMDARSGKEVYSQNADAKLHPASLTKMMTLYLAFESIERGRVSLDSKFLVSSNAASEPPSKLGLKAGQRIELRYLIRAAAVKSANDAATTIAEGLEGSVPAFAKRMNRTARALGMRNTNFLNANGLTAQGHYSTARDMTTLGRRLFYDYPQYYSIFSRRTADAGIARVSSTNKKFLDAYQGADGIKTGYTRASGFNLTASAQRGSKRVVATVLGGKTTAQRNDIMAQLLDAGFGRAPTRAQVIRPDPPAYLKEQAPVRQASTRRVIVAQEPVRNAALARPVPAGAVATTALQGSARTAAPNVAFVSPRPNPKPAKLAAIAAALSAPAPAAPAVASDDIRAALVLASAASNLRPETPMIEEGSAAEPDVISSPRPRARPAGGRKARAQATATEPRALREKVILASAGPSAPMPKPARETVARSGGGKGSWGVSLGVYAARVSAEKALVQTALAESGMLDEARQDVRDTKRGWEARFAGLSRDNAWLTCKRLEARNSECRVIAP